MTDTECDYLCPLANGCWLVPKLLYLVDKYGAGWAIQRKSSNHYRIIITFDGRYEPFQGPWVSEPKTAYQDALNFMNTLY